MNPKISVIMPCYNGEKYLREAIESILNQTFNDFEFIIINDGSKDNSLSIMIEYAEKDHRIKILDQKNTGIIGALNNAIEISKGKYIARMDADDISLPERFEKQINLLEKENAFICGTLAIAIDENGNEIRKMNYPKDNWIKNKFYLLRGCPIIHPSVIIKKEILTNNKNNWYRNYKNIEDYELWTRLIPKYKTINLQEYVFKYRIHSNQITQTANLEMKIKGIKIRLLGLLRLMISLF